MSKDERSPGPRQTRQPSRRWLLTWHDIAFLALIWLVDQFRPFAHLFGWESFENHHGNWPEWLLLIATLVLMDIVYARMRGRPWLQQELAAAEADIRAGRLQRAPLAARHTALFILLSLVSLGWFAEPPYGRQILVVAVPLFLLFVAMELNFILHPGESLVPDPNDELLQFFRARMLKVGYITTVLALITLYLTSLLASRWVGLLLPILLTVSLLLPAFVYRQLDRQAAVDG